MVNLKHKLRRPSGEEAADEGTSSSSLHDSIIKHQPIVEESASPILTRSRPAWKTSHPELTSIKTEMQSPTSVAASDSTCESESSSRVQFAPEPKWRGDDETDKKDHSDAGKTEAKPEPDLAATETNPSATVEAEIIPAEPPKRGGRPTRKGKKVESVANGDECKETQEPVETAVRSRKTRKSPERAATEPAVPASRKTKKVEESPGKEMNSPKVSLKKKSKESSSCVIESVGIPSIAEEPETVVKEKKPTVSRKLSVEVVAPVVEEKATSLRPAESEEVPKKTARKPRKPAEEKPAAVTTASPRSTKLPKAPEPVTPSRRNLLDQATKFTSPSSSPARKPFLVFR